MNYIHIIFQNQENTKLENVGEGFLEKINVKKNNGYLRNTNKNAKFQSKLQKKVYFFLSCTYKLIYQTKH